MKTTITKPDKSRAQAWLDAAIDSFPDGAELVIEIKKKPKHRSLTANAYAWVLIDKLADTYGIPPELVYREQLKELGGHATVVSVSIAAEEEMRQLWETRGLGWTVTRCGVYDDTVDLLLSYGSSAFTTYQMARFIDNLVQECKQLDIETMPPDELNSLIAAWEGAAA